MSAAPLRGIRVVELGRLLAAPLAAQTLADLGAEVVKVERPGLGDEFRGYGPVFLKDVEENPTRESSIYLSVNRNKQSITVDFTKDEGRQVVVDLVRTSDIFIENYRPGALAAHGLDYETLRAVKPDLIYLSVTGFGQSGPSAHQPGTDSVFQAISGLMSVTGDVDGPPVKVGTSVVDYVTGLYATVAALSALHHRDAGGGGQAIDVSLLGCSMALMSTRSLEYLLGGKVPERDGHRTSGTAPAGLFRCADGLLNVQAGMDSHFAKLCEALDLPDLARDPRYATRAERLRNKDVLERLLEAAFSRRTIDEWHEILSRAGVICAPIYDVAQSFEHPQVRHQQMRVTVPHPASDRVDLVRNPIQFSKTPIEAYTAPPMLGEHAEAVLKERLGYDTARIAELRRIGAI